MQSFLEFVSKYARHSYGQLCQDLFVLWALSGKTSGYFVELGGYDGVTLSNTFLLENLGWRGLTIEPIPEMFKTMQRARSCDMLQVAIAASPSETAEFRICEKAELSRLEAMAPADQHEMRGARAEYDTVSVQVMRLCEALERVNAPAEIDYLSLDTEGNELEILRDFPFDRFDVKCLTIEHNNTPRLADQDALLADHGFRRVLAKHSRFDGWYVGTKHWDRLQNAAPVTLSVPDGLVPCPPLAARHAQVLLGRDMIGLGMTKQAEAMAEALNCDADPTARLRLQGSLARAKEDHATLREVCNSLATSASTAPNIAQDLADWLAELGDDDRALEALSQIQAAPPGFAIKRGKILRRLGRAEEALVEFKAALAHNPGLAGAHLGYARCLCDLGRTQEAESHLRAHAARFPKHKGYNAAFLSTLLAYRRIAKPSSDFPKADDFDGRIRVGCEGAERISLANLAPDAGAIISDDTGEWQRMYNGVLMPRDSYYGAWMTRLLAETQGRHEPQEEQVFERVLPFLRPGSRMIELGAFWAFYSCSFLKHLDGKGEVVLVEPDAENLCVGLHSIQRNGFRAQARIGRVGPVADSVQPLRTRFGAKLIPPDSDVQAIMQQMGWDRLDLLHADIQGAEELLLKRIAPLLKLRAIRYIFISTHGHNLRRHTSCLTALADAGYVLIAEHDLSESYSNDGLIVARAPEESGPAFVDIPRRGV